MYYYNKRSSKKVVHSKECFRIANSDIENIGWFETLDEVYANGYRLCCNCNPIIIKYKKETKEIIEYSRQNGVAAVLCGTFINITSVYGRWRITLATDGEHIHLYHKNEFETKNDYKSAVRGYHLQNVQKGSILGYLRYIVGHDRYRRENPLYIRPQEKEPPRKGTHRYRKEQKKAKYIAKKRAVYNVLCLIDSLHMQTQPAM